MRLRTRLSLGATAHLLGDLGRDKDSAWRCGGTVGGIIKELPTVSVCVTGRSCTLCTFIHSLYKSNLSEKKIPLRFFFFFTWGKSLPTFPLPSHSQYLFFHSIPTPTPFLSLSLTIYISAQHESAILFSMSPQVWVQTRWSSHPSSQGS